MLSPVLLILIYLAFISLGLPDSVLGVAWPPMRESLGLPLEAVGLLSLLITLCSAASSFSTEFWLRRISTGPAVLISCLLTGGSLLVFSFAGSFAVLMLAAVPLGWGAGCVDSSLNAFVARHYSSRHMNWLHAFWGVGATVGPLLMTQAIAGAGGWSRGYREIAFLQLGLAALFLFTLPLWKVPETLTAPSATGETPHGRALANSPAGWLSVSSYLLYTGVEGTTGLWANSVLVERRGVPPITAGLWVACYFGAIMTGRILVGFVSERWNNRRLAAGGLYLCGLGAVCFSWPGPAELALIGLLLLGLGAAPVYPCLMHETPRRFTAAAAPVVIGRQVGSAYVGAALIPALMGWLAAQYGLQLIGPLVATFVVLILVVLHRLNRLT